MSFIDLGNLTEPVKVFVERVSDLIGGTLRPYQIRRIAEAEADAKMTTAVGDLNVEALRRRALQRWVTEEETKQANMEAIRAAAIPQIEAGARPDKIEQDWLVNFFDKCRLTSDADMRELWAKILAGEANAPGRFSKRAISMLGTMDRTDAEQFQTVCRFAWSFEEEAGIRLHLVLFEQHRLPNLKEAASAWAAAPSLEEMGLVRVFDHDSFSVAAPDEITVRVSPGKRCGYFNQSFEFQFPRDESIELPVGYVSLTRIGAELAEVCSAAPIPEFAERVRERWSSGFITLKPIVGE